MYGFWERFGTLAIAAALLFAALRVHKSSGKHARVTKTIGVVMAFLAGCALLVTFVGAWMGSLAGKGMAAFLVAGLIACGVIIIVDCMFDKKPDKPAFWAAFALAIFMVFGGASIPLATQQIGDGASQVGTQFSKVGTVAPAPNR